MSQIVSVNLKEKENKDPYQQAMEQATDSGYNRYSKPTTKEASDYETETHLYYHFKWAGKILQVVIEKLIPGFRFGEPVDENEILQTT